MSDEEIKVTKLKNRIYLDGAKSGMLFMNKVFHKFVPMWAGNIILVGGRTGGGKSSATANLILSTIEQINPITGKNRKVLVISNEEAPLQVYNRLTCLIHKYNYQKQEEFTEEQKQVLIDSIGIWPKKGITVIGEDGHGKTNSVDGIKSIFENLILIDYVQKISSSKKDPKAPHWKILKDVMDVLDYYKNEYPAPIVVMSQLSSGNTGDPNNEMDFQDRIRGGKDILTPCTVALEMVPDYENLTTKWRLWKNRYNGELVGGSRMTGYDRGRFVELTDEFKRNVVLMKEERGLQEINKLTKEPKTENNVTKE